MGMFPENLQAEKEEVEIFCPAIFFSQKIKLTDKLFQIKTCQQRKINKSIMKC